MAYATLEHNNFADIDHALGERRSLPLAPNTMAYRTGANESEIAISYHGNDIAIYNTSTASITLQTGGWNTNTTIDRLDQIARGNNIGSVKVVAGRVRFTHREENHSWYHMDDPITVNRPGKVEHNDPDRYNGYSNQDTYLAAAWCANPGGGEYEYKAILSMRRSELREYVKLNRQNIGYKSITNVNMIELFLSLQED